MKRRLSSEYKMLPTFQREPLSLWGGVDGVPAMRMVRKGRCCRGYLALTPLFFLPFFDCSLLAHVCLSVSLSLSPSLCFLPCHHMNSFCQMFPLPQCSASQQVWKHGTKSIRLWQNTWNNIWELRFISFQFMVTWQTVREEQVEGQGNTSPWEKFPVVCFLWLGT